MATNANVTIKKMEFAGKTIYYPSQNLGELFNLDVFSALKKMGSMSGQAMIVENGTLYIATSVQDMKSFIEDRASWKENIQANADFKSLEKYIQKEAFFVTYIDIREMFNYLWNTAIPVLRSLEGFIRTAGIPFSVADLPQATTISRHLKPFLITFASDKEGMTMSYTSPMTFVAPVVGLIGGGAAIAIPIIEKQQEKARQVMVKAQLRNMINAQQMYKLDRQGYGSFKQLVEKGYTYSVYESRNGVYSLGNYRVFMYRATKDGLLKADDETVGERFVIYAWPNSYKLGTVYAMNQDGEMVSTQTDQYNDWNVPQASAAFAEGADAEKLEGKFASGNAGQDSNIWNQE